MSNCSNPPRSGIQDKINCSGSLNLNASLHTMIVDDDTRLDYPSKDLPTSEISWTPAQIMKLEDKWYRTHKL